METTTDTTARDLAEHYEQLTTEQRRALADQVGIVPRYLYQLATGFQGRRPSMELTRKLAAATGLAPDRIRSDYWQRVADVTGIPADQLRQGAG